MATTPSLDRQTFLNYVRQSGLLREEQLAFVEKEYVDIPRGRTLARLLVEQEMLTRFQAERLLIGQTSGFILGQYRILEQIGRGGMGRVYKAEHQTMQRLVALKVLAPNLLKTERAVEMFLREVRAIAQLQHPNIVTAYDANEIQGRYYLVLEFVDGPNLEQLVRNKGPLSVGLACDYIKQAASGLQCAHLRGMLHRDIKPANILVQSHGIEGDESPGLVKVSDFGLARLGQPTSTNPTDASIAGTILTSDNSVMGTPDYLSPEQSRNMHNTDIRSDLYSLGCTFYFLLTGQVLFPGGNSLEKLICHATEKPRSVGAFRSDLPVGVVTILDRLLAKRPEDRYETPADVATALQPYAVSGPTPWAPPRGGSSLVDAQVTPAAKNTGMSSDPFLGPAGSDGEMATFAPTLADAEGFTPAPSAAKAGVMSGRTAQKRDLGPPPKAISAALLWSVLVVSILFLLAVVIAILGR